MNSVQFTIAAAIAVPGVVAAGMAVMPSGVGRQIARLESAQEAAIQRRATDENPQRFVLQPFYVPGGAFILQVETKGMRGLSALCSNLPIVHDAVITQLDADGLLFSQNIAPDYKADGEKFRRAINSSFSRPHVLGVGVTYYPDTTITLAGKRKAGSATRCLALEKTQHASSSKP